MKNPIIFLSFFLSVFFCACADNDNSHNITNPNLPDEAYDYQSRVENFNNIYFNASTAIDNDKATLGRVLFYDKHLSINQSISCASCHKQHLGFADNEAFSKGVNVTKTLRNSPSLSNLFRHHRFFWDRRAINLEDLIFQPITDHIEMGFQDTEMLIERINNTSYYPNLFEKAFGNQNITEEKITEAFVHYLNALTSFESDYDKFQNGMDPTLAFSPKELLGRDLFMTKALCSNCHNGPNFGGSSSANIGLQMEYEDNGIGTRLNDESLNGFFKVPSLRNIALSSPYMHDGRFSTLREVLNHYNNGIIQHPNLSWQLTIFEEDPFSWWEPPANGGEPIRLNLTEDELDAIEAFLHALTDYKFITEPMYSNPF